MSGTLKRAVCLHNWHQITANAAPADVGVWRWRCIECGAYRNDAGRIVGAQQKAAVVILDRLRRRNVAEEEPAPPPSYSAENPPPELEDARTYVAHGDRTWGNSITSRNVGEHEVSVAGWLARAPFPRVGDRLLIPMASGKWGVHLFSEVRISGNPSDMFTGSAVGAFDYHEPPKTKSCDEFIPNLSPYSR